MTELQKTELELLKTFCGICSELGLRYYLVCGSALGAEKYGGFIPWDDDADIAMPRSDYEVFIEKAPSMLSGDLFLQNFRTDPAFPQLFSKLRDSGTAFIEKSAAKLNINHGIYIDIFPLDGYPEGRLKAAFLELRKKIALMKVSCVFDVERSAKTKAACALFRFAGCRKRTAGIIGKLDKTLRKYPEKDSALWCNHGNWQGKLDYSPREHYADGKKAIFEGIEVMLPAETDAYLTQKYGDWRADLPESEKKGHHFYTVCDTEKPFTEYIKF